MKNLVFKTIFSVAVFTAIFLQNGCSKPENGGEQETINLIKIKLTDVFFSNEETNFFWSDFDGDGGLAPTIDTIRMKVDTNYSADLAFSNVSSGETAELNAEIQAEGAAHFVVWKSSNPKLEAAAIDPDSNGDLLGLKGFLKATEKGTFSLTIRLLHEPDKSNLAEPGGETDVEVTFPVVVQ